MAFNFPNNPTLGQQTVNPTSSQVYTWDGVAWSTSPLTASYALTSATASYVNIVGVGVDVNYVNNRIEITGSTVTVSDTAPTDDYQKTTGSLWFNSNDTALYVSYPNTGGTQWVGISPAGPTVSSSYALTSSLAQTASYFSGSITNAVSASYAASSSYKSDVSYLMAYRNTNQTITTGTDVIFDFVPAQNGITYNAGTGEFVLEANQAYRVTSQLSVAFQSSTGSISFALWNKTANAYGNGLTASPTNINSTAWVSKGNTIDNIICPNLTYTYTIRIVSSVPNQTVLPDCSYLTVQKLN